MATNLLAMASNLPAMASNLLAMASGLQPTSDASNLLAMASSLLAMASHVLAMASRLLAMGSHLLGSGRKDSKRFNGGTYIVAMALQRTSDASNLLAMASSLLAMASHLPAMASRLLAMGSHLLGSGRKDSKRINGGTILFDTFLQVQLRKQHAASRTLQSCWRQRQRRKEVLRSCLEDWSQQVSKGVHARHSSARHPMSRWEM